MGMYGLKDMTKLQAKRWVEQEAAKHTDAADIAERIKVELTLIEKGDRFDLPNSFEAHAALVRKLQLK
jgi:hypothetical protein